MWKINYDRYNNALHILSVLLGVVEADVGRQPVKSVSKQRQKYRQTIVSYTHCTALTVAFEKLQQMHLWGRHYNVIKHP